MMKEGQQKERSWIIVISLSIIAFVALGFTIHYTRGVLIPFVLAVFIFLLASPILDFQVLRLKFPRPIAFLVTLLLVVIILTVMIVLVSEAIQTIIATAGRYSDNFIALVEQVSTKLQSYGFGMGQEQIAEQLQTVVPKAVSGTFGTLVGFFSKALLVCIFLVFLLAGRNPRVVRQGLYAEIDQQVRRYIGIKAIVSIMTGLLVWVILSIFGMELASVFGMLALLLNFIPSIGSIIATLLPIPVAVAQYDNPWMIVAVICIPGMVQMIIGNVLEPRWTGRSLHLHPVTILLSLSFWGLLWGIPGIFLAVPITAAMRIVLMQFDTFKPVAEILAGRLPTDK